MMNETTPSPTAAASEDLEAASESRLRARVNGRRADALILALPDGGVAELPRGEFGARASAAAVGDTLDVFVLGERGSTALVSEAKADWLALWDRLLAAAGTDAPFEGEIVAEVKGGFVVDLGLRAFLPMSQAAARKGDTPTGLLFKRGRFQVIEFNAKRGTVVVSRRAEATAERGEARAEQLARLSVGDVVDGVVRRIVPYGAFLEVGAVEGLLHMKDIVWGRVENPAKALEVGQTVRVKVLEIESGGKVKLGLKQTQPDPWESVPSRYKGGQRVRGKVVSVAPFGAFLEVEPGVEGLLHVSEMSWTERVTDPAQFAPAGKHLEVVV
ncbi:MAG TPA: S1 RNA-binding domain-containing protein, partial [Myxococcota bacterium]|nr:S1 RNA-binding domain-containing protein [Myxococcota bacterium]